MHIKLVFVSLLTLISCSVFAQQLGDFVYSTEQITETQILSPGNLAYQVYLLHIDIGEQVISGSQSLLQDDVLLLISSLTSLSDYRVIDVMQHSQNKAAVLDDYIQSMESVLYKSNATQYQLQSDINSTSTEIDACLRQKKAADKEYTNTISSPISLSTKQLDSLVSASQTNSSCVATNTALLSARQQLLDNLIDASNKLGEKYDYLLSQQKLILDHFELLDSTYLQDILDVQKDIKNGGY